MIGTILTAIQIGCLLLLVVGGPAFAYLKLKWAKEAAERRANSERLRANGLARELEDTRSALDASQLRMVQEIREGVGPLDNPPPGVDPVWAFAMEHLPDDPYLYPFGWERVQGQASLVAASLHGDSPIRTNHGLITAKSDFGKDMLAFLIAWFLCRRNSPRTFQLVWIDGTMSDGAFFQGVAHNWVEPILGKDEVALAMEALRLERERRDKLRVQYGVDKWENLPDDVRPPLLLVYVSELDVLELGAPPDEDLEDWLKVELTSARKAGIRYAIGSQTVANRKTRWRDQITWYCVGHQDVERAILPNAGMSSAELEELGGMSPLKFPGPGYFTVRIGRNVATVRTPRVTLEERKRAIGMLPHRPVGITVAERVKRLRAEQERASSSTGKVVPLVPVVPASHPPPPSPQPPREPDLDIVARWELQVRRWAAIPLSRRKMVERMGMRRQDAYAVLLAILGPAGSTPDPVVHELVEKKDHALPVPPARRA